MKKSTLLYAAGLVAYMVVSRSLKNKDSELSKMVKKYADSVTTFLTKFTQKGSSDNQETGRDEDNKSSLKNASKIGASGASSSVFNSAN